MNKQTLEMLEDIRIDLSRMRARLNQESERLEELELKLGNIVQKENDELEKMLEDQEKHDREIREISKALESLPYPTMDSLVVGINNYTKNLKEQACRQREVEKHTKLEQAI